MNYNNRTIIRIILLILLHVSNVYGEFEIMILHNNDLRFTTEETTVNGKEFGGLARIASVVKQARRNAVDGKGPPVLYLDAGDIYVDGVWANPFAKKIAIEFLNLLMPDAACLGSHDFDYGIENLRSFIKRIKFPLVACNIRFSNESRLFGRIEKYITFHIKNKKIVVVGYITAKNHLLKGQKHIIIEDEVTAMQNECNRLKYQHVHMVIALGHSGYVEDLKIAEEVECVDLVVGGLTNTFLWTGVSPHEESPLGPYPTVVTTKTGKRVLVVTTPGYTKYIGQIKLTYDDSNNLISYEGHPIFLDSTIGKDADVVHLMEMYDPTLRAVSNDDDVLGQTVVVLDAKDVRLEESNLANFIMDSFVHFLGASTGSLYWTETAIAVMNAGAIRKSLNTSRESPNITKKMLTEVLPFRQRLVIVNILGSSLLQALEAAVRSNGETRGGEFFQMSGLRVCYDFGKPTGNRVVYAKTYCTRCEYPNYVYVDPNKHYRTIINTFLANGGDGITVFKTQGLSFEPIDSYEIEVIQDAIRTRGQIRPELEERIMYANKLRRKPQDILLMKASNFHEFVLIKVICSCVFFLIITMLRK